MSYFVSPYPRPSEGLLDGATEIIGGDPLQEPVMIDLSSNAEGEIIIPAEHGGGIVTWIRGVWDAGTKFHYDAFMAGTNPSNATNYMGAGSGATAENKYVGGIYYTVLRLKSPTTFTPNTVYHVRFSRRSGQTVKKGSPINGWPYNYVDPDYYGTAVDGDMYTLWALALAYAATGKQKYQTLHNRIALANLDAGRPQGNEFHFDLPFEAEAGQIGLYDYYQDIEGTQTTFAIDVVPKVTIPGNCLSIQAHVPSGSFIIEGQTYYNYAGFGCWQSWQLTETEPFTSFVLHLDGGGCGRNIELSTNVVLNDPTGDVGLLVPCLTAEAGNFTEFEFFATDFWRLHNILWDHKHKTEYWTSAATHSTFQNIELTDSIALQYSFSFTRNPTYGTDLLTDGDFSTGLGTWINASYNSGSVVIQNEAATVSHTSTGRGRLRHAVTVETGKQYRIEFTCFGFVTAEPFLDLGTTAGGYDIQSNISCNNGLNVIERSFTNTSLWLNFFSQSANIPYTIDNVRVREITGGGQTTYGDVGIDKTVCDSTGTSTLHLDILPSVSGTLRVVVYGTPASYTYTSDLTLTAATRQIYTITWATFGTVVHPIQKIRLTPVDHDQGNYILFGAWYDNIITIADLPVDVFDGFEFQFPSYETGPDYNLRFGYIKLGVDLQDGTPADKQRYPGIPRWTYKWTVKDGWLGYGMWRGWSGVGYLWLPGWTNSGIINPDNNRSFVQMQRDFIEDAQNEYVRQFGGPIGPLMPRYGRPSWEALNQEGIVEETVTYNTYNKWYFVWNEDLSAELVGWSDDWYGYSCRAYLSCAADYFVNPTNQVKTILDNLISWFNEGERSLTETITWSEAPIPSKAGTYALSGDPVIGIIWDEDHWHPPSEYNANGRVRYNYNPIYSYACIAQAMLYKYWTDGDADALKWLGRMLDYMSAQQITANGSVSVLTVNESLEEDYVTATAGSLVIVQRGEEGSGYTTATVTIEGDGVGAAVRPKIFAGRIRYYEIVNVGSGYTWIRGTVVGDGTGATVVLALYDRLIGAFDLYHTGWEVFEIYNTYALLALGHDPMGTVNFPYQLPEAANKVRLLETFFNTNTSDQYPMMFLANYLPMHEYGGWDPYHNGDGLENPMVRDSRTRGKTWTETSGPCLRSGVLSYLLHGECAWLEPVFRFHVELSGAIYEIEVGDLVRFSKQVGFLLSGKQETTGLAATLTNSSAIAGIDLNFEDTVANTLQEYTGKPLDRSTALAINNVTRTVEFTTFFPTVNTSQPLQETSLALTDWFAACGASVTLTETELQFSNETPNTTRLTLQVRKPAENGPGDNAYSLVDGVGVVGLVLEAKKLGRFMFKFFGTPELPVYEPAKHPEFGAQKLQVLGPIKQENIISALLTDLETLIAIPVCFSKLETDSLFGFETAQQLLSCSELFDRIPKAVAVALTVLVNSQNSVLMVTPEYCLGRRYSLEMKFGLAQYPITLLFTELQLADYKKAPIGELAGLSIGFINSGFTRLTFTGPTGE